MRNLCFTERSLQFSEFTHKSLGSSFSLPSLFFLSMPFFFPHRRRLHPSPSFLPSSLLCSDPGTRARAGMRGARAAPERARRVGGCGSRAEARGAGERALRGRAARVARAGAARQQVRASGSGGAERGRVAGGQAREQAA
jgi:hypothetical protein